MPGMNGTGPEGQGSRTGRGAGRCAVGAGRRNVVEVGNTGQSTIQNNGRGPGMGRGGRGRGKNSGCGNRARFGNR